MYSYIQAIKQALIYFPILAIIFTIPYIIYNYKKYGSILSLRAWIIYSFILYLLCVYCLVILPLPTPEKALELTAYRTQLIPFNFMADIIKHAHIQISNPKSYLGLINNWAFLTTIFNIFMTLPFGFYLKYYFQNTLKSTLIKTFLLSLFFELTQLSGLYFIYRANYRLFDVDDLITNTLGGLIGFLLATFLSRFLPSRTEIDQKSYSRSQKVSLLRRLVAMGFDTVGVTIFGLLFSQFFFKSFNFLTFPVLTISYLTISAVIFKGRTFGFLMTNLKITSIDDPNNNPVKWYQYLLRFIYFFVQFAFIPLLIIQLVILSIENISLNEESAVIIIFISGLLYLFYLGVMSIFVALHKPLAYEKFSKTQLENTLTKKVPKR